MVVTFLLIILAIAIFVLSQSIAKTYIETQSERTVQGGGDKVSVEELSASNVFENPIEVEETDPNAKPQTAQTAAESQAESTSSSTETVVSDLEVEATETSPESQPEIDSSSSFNPQLAEELKSNQDVDPGKELSVLSRRVLEDEERIIVASPDTTEDEQATTRVTRAASILTLQFDPIATKIDEQSATSVREFIGDASEAIQDKEIVIWSFANASALSISEARRVAYYRALATRNELINSGVPNELINVQIRLDEGNSTRDTVQVVVR